MSNVRQILVSAIGLVLVGVALGGCGQKGALYLPTEPAAKDRATLPELLLPNSNGKDAAAGGTGATPAQRPADANGTSAPKSEGTK
ncbi:LPS translocon maturation chaperone LptM [Variovorax sp. JS1663]|uniref:LPS translocon maturation chaperone LptM n=1 Tax=Variovorax sp. JS1663 TaxID=1851577 RepID=UPI000B34258A|nr:lipoprotein [Variovorax sp. JS1663]